MKSYVIVVIIAVFTVLSCSDKKSSKKEDLESAVVNNKEVPKQSEAYILFKNNCYACHSVTSTSHDEIIAPPMAAIKFRYTKEYSTREEFINAMVNWAKDPKKENALMNGAVKRFNIMPKQVFKEEDLKKIATYIYDTKIEQPEWFAAHFKEMQGGEDHEKGMMGMKNWKEQMKLDHGKKWTANIETTKGVEKLQELLKNDTSTSVEEYHNLAKQLSGELSIILDKCTMKGASHDNLHTFLLPLLKKVDKLKEVNSVEKGNIISSKIREHLQAYKKYFN